MSGKYLQKWTLSFTWLLVSLLPQAFTCSENSPTPTLKSVSIENLKVDLLDTAILKLGVRVNWKWDSTQPVTRFQIYQAWGEKSQKLLTMSVVDAKARSGFIPLPDTSAPFELWIGVEAVLVEETGALRRSDTILLTKMLYGSNIRLLSPYPGEKLVNRKVNFEFSTHSDLGIYTRLLLIRDDKGQRESYQSCFPVSTCGRPIFLDRQLGDSLLLGPPLVDLAKISWCIQGNEGDTTTNSDYYQNFSCASFFLVKDLGIK